MILAFYLNFYMIFILRNINRDERTLTLKRFLVSSYRSSSLYSALISSYVAMRRSAAIGEQCTWPTVACIQT